MFSLKNAHSKSCQLITKWWIFIRILHSINKLAFPVFEFAKFCTLRYQCKSLVYVISENDEEQPSSPSVKKSEETGVAVVHEVKCKLYVKVCILIFRPAYLIFCSCFNSTWFGSLGMFSQVIQPIRMYGKIEEWAICPLNAKRGLLRLQKSPNLQSLFETRFVCFISSSVNWPKCIFRLFAFSLRISLIVSVSVICNNGR